MAASDEVQKAIDELDQDIKTLTISTSDLQHVFDEQAKGLNQDFGAIDAELAQIPLDMEEENNSAESEQ